MSKTDTFVPCPLDDREQESYLWAMDLEQYRQTNHLTYERLAERLGLTHRTIAHSYAVGKRWPKPLRMKEILERTKSQVTVEAMWKRALEWDLAHGQRGGAELS